MLLLLCQYAMLTYASDAGAYFKELQHLLRLCHYATCGALASFTDDAQVLLVLCSSLRPHSLLLVLLIYFCFTAAVLLLSPPSLTMRILLL